MQLAECGSNSMQLRIFCIFHSAQISQQSWQLPLQSHCTHRDCNFTSVFFSRKLHTANKIDGGIVCDSSFLPKLWIYGYLLVGLDSVWIYSMRKTQLNRGNKCRRDENQLFKQKKIFNSANQCVCRLLTECTSVSGKYPCQIFISFDVIMCLTLIWCCVIPPCSFDKLFFFWQFTTSSISPKLADNHSTHIWREKVECAWASMLITEILTSDGNERAPFNNSFERRTHTRETDERRIRLLHNSQTIYEILLMKSSNG